MKAQTPMKMSMKTFTVAVVAENPARLVVDALGRGLGQDQRIR